MSCVTCHECDGKYIWWLRGEDVTLSRDRITLPSQILSTVTRKMSQCWWFSEEMTKCFPFQCLAFSIPKESWLSLCNFRSSDE